MLLGDRIEQITTVTGIKWIISKLFKKDCGCKERKEKLNNLNIKINASK
jgi:hypothetical protein